MSLVTSEERNQSVHSPSSSNYHMSRPVNQVSLKQKIFTFKKREGFQNWEMTQNIKGISMKSVTLENVPVSSLCPWQTTHIYRRLYHEISIDVHRTLPISVEF